MSFQIDPKTLNGAEKIPSADDLYQMGIEASTPGVGAEQDLITAHKCFNLAAMQGNLVAKEYRQQLTLEMSPQQIAKAQREAREWLASCRATVM